MKDFDINTFRAFQKAGQKAWKNEAAILTGLDEIPAVQVVPIGDPAFDKLLAGHSDVGGIIRGGIVEIAGQFSSGKTTLSLEYLARFMKEQPNRAVAFIDVEAAFDSEYAKHLGVDVDSERFIYSRPLSGQEAVSVAAKLIETGMFSCIVMDSWAALIPPRQAAKDVIGDHSVGDHAKLSSDALRAITPLTKPNDCTFIILNQERIKMTPMGARGKQTTGGNAIAFYTDMRLSVNKVKKDSDDRSVVVVKAKSQALPWTECTISIKHGIGLDRLASVINLGITDKHIVTGGAGWMTLAFWEGKRIQGMNKLCEFLREDNDARKALCDALGIPEFTPRTMLVKKVVGDVQFDSDESNEPKEAQED